MYSLIQTEQLSEQETLKMGDFKVIKVYDIHTTTTPSIIAKINGIIIQHVIRKTICSSLKNGQLLNTEKRIARFTNNAVQWSTASYYEYFTVFNGESVFADMFASGAVTNYSRGYPVLTPNLYTSGSTTYSAKSVFIAQDNPLFNTIYNLPWDTSPHLPSNGLPYIKSTAKTTPIFNSIFKTKPTNRNSNIARHNLRATWSKTHPTTKLVQQINNTI